MIETHDLRRTFKLRGKAPDVEAVRGINLEVGASEIFGFLGPNGAGKTTTLRMLATLLAPTSGTATVAGADLAREPQAVRRRIGYVPQDVELFEGTVAENNSRFQPGAAAGLRPGDGRGVGEGARAGLPRPVARLGRRIEPEKDEVERDGSIVPLKADLEYLLLNKPEGVVSTAKATHGRRNVIDLVDAHVWDSSGVATDTSHMELQMRTTYANAATVLARFDAGLQHVVEEVLESLRNGAAQPTGPCISRLLEAVEDVASSQEP